MFKLSVVYSSNTNLSLVRFALRHSSGQQVLQKNYRFESFFWEDAQTRTTFMVGLQRFSAMSLMPLAQKVRFCLLSKTFQGEKQFAFKLLTFGEALQQSVNILVFEESGVSFLYRVSLQEFNFLNQTSARNFYGLSNAVVSFRNSALYVNSFLVRIYFTVLFREKYSAKNMLWKFKRVFLAFSKNQKLFLVKDKGPNLMWLLRIKYVNTAPLSLTHNSSLLRFGASRLVSNKVALSLGLKRFVWKRGSLAMNRYFIYGRLQRAYNFSNHKLTKRDNSGSFFYLLRRLADKYENLYRINAVAAQRLLVARNSLLVLAENHLHNLRRNSLVLGRSNGVRLLRRYFWRNLLVEAVFRRAEYTLVGRESLQKFFNAISLFIGADFLKERGELNFQTPSLSNGDVLESERLNLLVPKYSSWQRMLRLYRQPFANKKVVEKESAHSFLGYLDVISSLTGRETSVFFINALALTRYAFQTEGKGKSSQRFLQNIDREMFSRYKYVAVYIQDFIRVSFIALFLKKPAFLAQFMALQISRLPRNRKETKMVRFLIKVVKVFAAQRREVMGLRILFKGRVNRWRRTKQIIGEKGILPLQSFNTRVEFGSAKAITRKGTLGIRLWICYNPVFRRELRRVFVDYVEYSQQYRIRLLRNFLGRMSVTSENKFN